MKQSGAVECVLPCDFLSEEELQARNGEVFTYRLGEPMDHARFAAMPEDLQRMYLDGLAARFGASDAALGRLLGLSAAEMSRLSRTLGRKPLGGRMSARHKEEWEAWRQGAEPPEPEAVRQPQPEGGFPLTCEQLEQAIRRYKQAVEEGEIERADFWDFCGRIDVSDEAVFALLDKPDGQEQLAQLFLKYITWQKGQYLAGKGWCGNNSSKALFALKQKLGGYQFSDKQEPQAAGELHIRVSFGIKDAFK